MSNTKDWNTLKTVRMASLFYLALLAPGFARATTPSDRIDVHAYKFTIEVNDTTNVIKGVAEIEFIARKHITDFEIDLISQGVDGKGMLVSGVTGHERALRFTHQENRLKIVLDRPLEGGDTSVVIVEYSGIPREGLIISTNKFGDRTFFADNWPNRGRNWIPVVDHPADKAMVSFTVIAPMHYEVVANGVRKEETFLNERQKLTRYVQEVPISSKVMVIGVARFAVCQSGVVNHIPIEAWVYPQNRDDGFRGYAKAVDVMEYFISQIGPYPYGKLANVQSKTTYGGLENASAIFYNENSVRPGGTSESLISHEIAHQWFGNSATETDWAHVWLSEGFATYFSLLYDEYKHGVELRREKMIEDREQIIAYSKKVSRPIVYSSFVDPMELLNANSYQKGGWVLHMLRTMIGDSAFWTGIQAYYAEYRDANAETADFRKVMERVSGEDLSRFFEQWVFTAGQPVLDVSWKYLRSSRSIEVTVRQLQKGKIFDFPLEIAVFSPGEPNYQVHSLHINKESQVIAIPAAQTPSKVELDPHVNLLFEGNLRN